MSATRSPRSRRSPRTWRTKRRSRSRVEYEPLPTIASVEEALATPSPQIHSYADDGNLHKLLSMEFGDVEAGFAEADRIFEDTFFYDGNTHLPMEQHATVALPEDDGRVTVWSSTQTPHYLHRALTKVLGLPASRIRVVATPNGGGFGGKSDPFGHEIVCAAMALKLGRPAKISLTREEVFYCHRGRHPVLMRMKTGVRKDGTLTAQTLQTTLDGGAYGSYGVASTYYTGALQTVTYRLPRYKFESIRAFTNKPACGPKRGHGTPQPRFGFEVQLDKIAVELGQNPADLRLRMVEQPNTVTANWLKLGTIALGALHRGGGRGLGLPRALGQAPPGARPRPRLRQLPLRRGTADLLEPHAAVGRHAARRSRRRRRGLLRRDRDRPGLGLGAGGGGRGGPRPRARRSALAGGRYRVHPGRPRQLLLARHADDGARGARRRREGPRGRLAGGRRGSSVSPSRSSSSPAGGCSTPPIPTGDSPGRRR